MLRTVSIKLDTTTEQTAALLALQSAHADACNTLVPVVIANRFWNRVALHRLSYCNIRANSPLGAQIVCKPHKAQAVGITVIFVNPAHSSQTCSLCVELGLRQKHPSSCLGAFQAHADCDANRNLARIAEDISSATADVNQPNVAA